MKLDEKTLQDLKDKKLQFGDLSRQYFIDSDDCIETDNTLKLLNNNLCSFQQIVNKFEEFWNSYEALCLYKLFWNKDLFKELIQNNALTTEDLKYLLRKIENTNELQAVCENTSLIKKVLSEFILDKELSARFNVIVEKIKSGNRYDYYGVSDVFDLIEFYETNYWLEEGDWCRGYFEREDKEDIDKELLKLANLNRFICSFKLTKEKASSLIKILKNTELAQDRLFQILSNKLESNYNFESLLEYLKKPEKRSLMNI